jgi:Holliday junction resolvase RusA-like endonuclease
MSQQPKEKENQQSPSPASPPHCQLQLQLQQCDSIDLGEASHDQQHLFLPFKCPSANVYYRKWNNRIVISPEGRAFKKAVHHHCFMQSVNRLSGSVRLTILLEFHDRRKRDLDNSLKPLLDALKCVMFDDDDRVMELHVTKKIGQENDRVAVKVERI